MKKNIFVLGMEPFAREKLQSIRDAEAYAFHELLPYEALVKPESYDFEALLAEADQTLREFSGRVDAIINHWDFPGTELLPLLCKRHGLRGPSMETTLKCGHKYWSRREQVHSVAEHTPQFEAVDPFSDHAFNVGLGYPFWLKPVKAFASSLGFKVINDQTFNDAIRVLRTNLRRIGDPFSVAMKYADVPEDIAAIDGNWCIAEQIISGRQGAVEAHVFNGEVRVHAALDMLREEGRSSFYCFLYPSQLPHFVLDQVEEATQRFIEHIGLDNTVFNVEFFWDEKSGRIWIIEINPRMSQSHSHFFTQVDGASNHQIAVDLALGREPWFPNGEGPYSVAGKFMWRKYVEDALVTAVPREEEIRRLEQEMPGTEIYIQVEQGLRLSDLRDQDPYSYELAIILTAADSVEALMENFERCKAGLTFEFAEAAEAEALRETA